MKTGYLSRLFLIIIILSLGVKAPLNISSKPLSKDIYHPCLASNGNITIDGNNDFIASADLYGWTGDGSSETPYIIKDLNLSIHSGAGIAIENTNLHFKLQNISVTGDNENLTYGFRFKNVTNGILYQISAKNHKGPYSSNMGIGFSFENCSDINVVKSYASNCTYGIHFQTNCRNNNITDCVIEKNNLFGIYLTTWFTSSDFSKQFKIENNTFTENQVGIGLGFWALSIEITNNLIFLNDIGILITGYTSNNIIRNNYIYQNELYGIAMGECISSYFINNSVYENGYYGISTNIDSSKNVFAFNHISNNSKFGVYDQNSEKRLQGRKEIRNLEKNIFINNNFISNNQGGNQAFINNSNYEFENNYWSDFLTPDNNHNGIVDDPYLIDGEISLKDKKPVNELNVYLGEEIVYPSNSISWIFYLSFPIIIGFIMMYFLKRRRKLHPN